MGSVSWAPVAASAYTLSGCRYASSSKNVNNTLQGAYDSALIAGIADWSNRTDVNAYSQRATSDLTARLVFEGQNHREGVAFRTCNAFGTITSCTFQVNSFYTANFTNNPTRLKILWTHELGHCLGLSHSANTVAVMWTCPSCAYNAGTTRLTSDDVNGMNAIY